MPAICLDSDQDSKIAGVELGLVEVVQSLSEINSIANQTKPCNPRTTNSALACRRYKRAWSETTPKCELRA